MYENNLKDILALDSGTLVIGQKGLPMVDDVLSYVAQKLHFKKERLHLHPDFVFVTAEKDKKTIGVEVADVLIRKSRYAPTSSNTIYMVIDGIDLFTEQAQNRVLKLFEDSTNVTIIAISYGGRVLPTIQSRLLVYHYHKLFVTDFLQYCKDTHTENPLMWFYVCDGCPTLISELLPIQDVFLNLTSAVEKEDKKAVFESLSLIKEKDPDTELYKPYYTQIFSLLTNLYSEKMVLWLNNKQYTNSQSGHLLIKQNHMALNQIYNCINICSENKSQCTSSTYTKDNFFFAICSLFYNQKEE